MYVCGTFTLHIIILCACEHDVRSIATTSTVTFLLPSFEQFIKCSLLYCSSSAECMFFVCVFPGMERQILFYACFGHRSCVSYLQRPYY